jgi:excisionase family DNA binding protein
MSQANLITVREMAKKLNCHPETIRRMLRKQELHGGIKMGSDWRIDQDAAIISLSHSSSDTTKNN